MMTQETGCCGAPCRSCPAQIATRHDDDEKRRAVAESWSRKYRSPITADDIHCMGCVSKGPHFSFCGRCPVRACALARKVRTCAHCPDYICETLERFIAHAPDVGTYLENVRSSLSQAE